MKQIRIRQLFKVIKLVSRFNIQSDAQSDIEHAALNIIYLL